MTLNFEEKLRAAQEGISTAWNNLMATVKSRVSEWCLEIPSTSSANTYKWVNLLVAIREWIGPRVMGNLQAQDWTIKNKDYEGSFPLDKNDIDDDNLGLLMPNTQSLFGAAQNHWESLAFQALLDGFTKVCYDGQLFFDTDHPSLTADGTTVSNKGTAAFEYEALKDAWYNSFGNIIGPTGEALDIEPYEVQVGPSNWAKANDYYNKQFKPGGAGEDNELKGIAKPRKNPKFVGAYANYWVVLARIRGNSLTPVVVQVRKQPEITSTLIKGSNDLGIPAEDQGTFETREVRFGTHQRGAATFTWWILGYGSDGSVA